YSALSTQFDAIELNSFSGDGLAWVRKEQSALQTAANSVSGTCWIHRYMSAVQISTSLQQLIAYDGLTKASQTSKTPSSPTATSTSKATPSEWLLNTTAGTSVDAYQNFILTLPDRGSGRQIVYEEVDLLFYVARMTRREANIVNRLPIIDQLIPNERLQTIKEDPSEWYMKILSLPKVKDIRSLGDNNHTYDYMLEGISGELAGLYIEYRIFTGTDIAPIDYWLHGMAVAAMVAGRTLGVTKKATLALVKFEEKPGAAGPDKIFEAWGWATRDVVLEGRAKKAVLVWPHGLRPPYDLDANGHVEGFYSSPFNLPRPRHADMWVPVLASCIKSGIVVVISSGNNPHPDEPYQGWISPQRFATPQNALITVGSINQDGTISQWNLPIGGPSADGSLLYGHFSVFAMGSGVRIPDLDPSDPSRYKYVDGTSVSAPQVAGLAAYYLTLPNSVIPFQAIRVPMAVKDHIVRLARDYSHDGAGTAYNSVQEALCGPINNPKRNHRAAGIVPFNETDAIDPEAAWKEWLSMGIGPDEFSTGD
ncbi:MAG: hypothetical protein Q9228_006873, partial [Teloschistes exilis]